MNRRSALLNPEQYKFQQELVKYRLRIINLFKLAIELININTYNRTY